MTLEAARQERTAAIILAAGAASRMGRLKQLLPYRGKTLLQHAVEQAVAAGFQPVVVVLGAQARRLEEVLAGCNVDIVQNSAWETGMGSSIAAGMKQLSASRAAVGAVAILAGDQPLITSQHLIAMNELLYRREEPIVAAEYEGTLGVPAIFRQDMFPALLALPPAAGARALIRTSRARVISFPLPEAAADIDTPADAARITATHQF